MLEKIYFTLVVLKAIYFYFLINQDIEADAKENQH